MRGFIFVLFIFVLCGTCFANAFESEVLYVDDMGSFSGAILKIKNSPDGNLGDKILPSEYLVASGILKFNIKTSLSEVFLNIVVTKNGEIVETFEEGPFVVDGTQILIDKRKSAVDVVPVVEVSNESVVENDTVAEIVSPIAVESSTVDNNPKTIIIDDYANNVEDGINAFVLYAIGGLLTFVILMIMWFKFEMFRGWLTRINYFSEDGELARLEAEIKRKDNLMDRIKEKEIKDKKIVLAKRKLELESKKLEKIIKKKMKKKMKKTH